MWSSFQRCIIVCLIVGLFLWISRAATPPEAFGKDKFAKTVKLECLIALSKMVGPDQSVAVELEQLLFQSLLVVDDKTLANAFWALGNCHLLRKDTESAVMYWTHSVHLMFRVMPVTSHRVLRCLFRLLWVIACGDDHSASHIPGLIPVDRAFVMTLHSYQTGELWPECLCRLWGFG